jgi:hypothetical protein
MVLSPAQVVHPTDDEPAKRALAYEQAIAETRHEAEKAKAAKKADIPPFETVTSEPQADTATADSGTNAVQDLPPDEENPGSQDLASLPDEDAGAQDGTNNGQWSQDQSQQDSQDMAALPDGQEAAPYDGVPPLPGEEGAASDQYGTDGGEQWGDERGGPYADGPPQVDVYGRPRHGAFRRPPTATADPYGSPDQGDPYGSPQADQWNGDDSTQGADQNGEEWVDVMVSGAPMRATASDDAPMLFAFPYGRNLKVVSRYEGWVEVTDPKSGATGWMQAGVLAPSAANRDPYGQNQAYYDDAPRRGRRGGWLERNADEFSDMLNRAFGGGGGY